MSSRTLRLTLAASTVVLALAAAMSCSTSSNTPPDVVGPGPGGPGSGAPSIIEVAPAQTCANAGNTVAISGGNLVGDSFVTDVTINGVRADVVDRIDSLVTGGLDV